MKKAAEQAGVDGRRLLALDALRGLIIVVMALDYANHFVAQQHSPGEYWGGLFPSSDNALRFSRTWLRTLPRRAFSFSWARV